MPRIFKFLIVAWVLCLFLVFTTHCQVEAHEGHGFKHMKKGTTTGPIIKAKYCPDGTLLNWIDYNNDKVIDVCKKIMFIHEKLHVKEIEPINNECFCEEVKDAEDKTDK